MSPKGNARFITSPKGSKLDFKQEFKNASQMLRQEASFNSQTYGGGYMPDSYGSKA
jgi:hypothetical protein